MRTLLLAAAAWFPIRGAGADERTEGSPSHAMETEGERSRSSLAETGSERDHLLGDWGGARSRWFERGLHLQSGYVGETFGNVSGGLRRGVVYEGLAEWAVELDFARLLGRELNLRMRASGIYPHGRSPTRELTGDLQTLSNIDAYDSPALYEWWLEGGWLGDRVSWRVGQLLADIEFAGTTYGGTLLNGTFGWPTFISGNTRNNGPAYARAALGVRLRTEVTEHTYVQAGIFDGDIFDDREGRPSRNPHGANWHLSSGQGAFVIGELGWSCGAGDAPGGLPAAYKLGAWMHTSRFDHVAPIGARRRPNYGVYVAAEQLLWREQPSDDESEQGLGIFGRVGVSPEDRNAIQVGFDAGLYYLGLIPTRDRDVSVLGFTVANLSDRFRDATGGLLSDYELVLEATYQCHLTPWWNIQPDLQWVHRPGASRTIRDAVVLGLRTRITF